MSNKHQVMRKSIISAHISTNWGTWVLSSHTELCQMIGMIHFVISKLKHHRRDIGK